MTYAYDEVIADDGTVLYRQLDPLSIDVRIPSDTTRYFEKQIIVSYPNGEYREKVTLKIYLSSHKLSNSQMSDVQETLSILLGLNPQIFNTPEITQECMSLMRGFGINTDYIKDPIVSQLAKRLYNAESAIKGLESCMADFWSFAKESYQDIQGNINSVDDFTTCALSFSVVEKMKAYTPILIGIANHKNTIEAARFLPDFLEQDEHNTLHDFIENTQFEFSILKNTDVLDFINGNRNKIKSPKIYDAIKNAEKKSLKRIIRKRFTFSSSSSVGAALFELEGKLKEEDGSSYDNSSQAMAELLSDFSRIYEILSENYTDKSHDKVSDMQKQIVLDISNIGFERTISSSHYKSVAWLKEVLEKVELEESDIYPILWFFNSTNEWAQGDSDKTILSILMENLKPEKVAEIAIDAYANNVFATTANWVKYIENHEEFEGINLELALAFDSKRRTRRNSH